MKGMKVVYNERYVNDCPYMPRQMPGTVQPNGHQPGYWRYPNAPECPCGCMGMPSFDSHRGYRPALQDNGGQPFVVDIEEAAEANMTFRRVIWTGEQFQVTLMSIPVGGDVGLEVHPDTDQFLRVEEGRGLVRMGDQKDQLTFERIVDEDDAIMVPAGKWHNLINTGSQPLKLYSIYAPPAHPFGTVHQTQQEAMEAENY